VYGALVSECETNLSECRSKMLRAGGNTAGGGSQLNSAARAPAAAVTPSSGNSGVYQLEATLPGGGGDEAARGAAKRERECEQPVGNIHRNWGSTTPAPAAPVAPALAAPAAPFAPAPSAPIPANPAAHAASTTYAPAPSAAPAVAPAPAPAHAATGPKSAKHNWGANARFHGARDDDESISDEEELCFEREVPAPGGGILTLLCARVCLCVCMYVLMRYACIDEQTVCVCVQEQSWSPSLRECICSFELNCKGNACEAARSIGPGMAPRGGGASWRQGGGGASGFGGGRGGGGGFGGGEGGGGGERGGGGGRGGGRGAREPSSESSGGGGGGYAASRKAAAAAADAAANGGRGGNFVSAGAGPVRSCSSTPRRRIPLSSRNEGSMYVA